MKQMKKTQVSADNILLVWWCFLVSMTILVEVKFRQVVQRAWLKNPVCLVYGNHAALWFWLRRAGVAGECVCVMPHPSHARDKTWLNIIKLSPSTWSYLKDSSFFQAQTMQTLFLLKAHQMCQIIPKVTSAKYFKDVQVCHNLQHQIVTTEHYLYNPDTPTPSYVHSGLLLWTSHLKSPAEIKKLCRGELLPSAHKH